jgi:hypothetical protein
MKQIWQRLSKREKGLVACAFAVLLLVLVRYLLIGPFLERREWVRSQLDIQPQLLDRNIRYLGRRQEMEDALEKARTELKSLEPSLLSGDTAPVSASNLQETVQSLAAKEGTQVVTTRVLNPEAVGLFIKIPIQLEISGQLDQLVNLIKDIESADKLLGMSEMNIRSIFTPAAARQQSGSATPMQNLRVSLTIAGFNRSQPVSSPQSAQSSPDRTQTKAPGPAEPKAEPGKASPSGRLPPK